MESELSIARRIRQLAEERPDEKVYRHVGADGSELAFTWPELDRRSSQLAGAFAERGLGFGDRVGLALRNSPQLTLGILAAWKLGSVPITVRWDVPAWELERVRQAMAPRLFIGPDDLDWIDSTATSDVPDLPDLISPYVNGICSSGSTGTPKIILAQRRGVYDPLLTAPIMEHWRPVTRPQTILILAPMYHTNGFAAIPFMLTGDRSVVMEKFDAPRVLDLIERCRISLFIATPTMLKRIADVPGIEQRDLSSIDWIMQGAAPMPPSLVHRWAGLIDAERIVMVYSMTENLGITALRGDEWMNHEGSVGLPFRGTEVRILDSQQQDLPAGEIGEIYLRSAQYTGSIYLGSTPSLPHTDDGFLSVGDLGFVDGDGYLYLVDRRVDMIISGGANVFPAEVEAALIDHPKIVDVVVIGLPDPDWGRRVHVIVQPADTADPPTFEEIRDYAKTRLAPYKVPKTFELVDAIPRSEATKVNRGALAAARGG